MLIPVKHLINGRSIAQIEVDAITYWHVELPTHDVILANGLPAERFIDTGNRRAFEDGGKVVTLFPDLAPLTWDGYGILPLVVTGPILEKVKQRLESRCGRRRNRAA